MAALAREPGSIAERRPGQGSGVFVFQITTTATTGLERATTMQMGQNDSVVKSGRKTLSTRRPLRSLPVECEGHNYRATAGWFDDGQLAEIFLDTGKFGTALQANADTAAILVSLLLQHDVAPDVILHSITRPIAIALRIFMGETLCPRNPCLPPSRSHGRCGKTGG